MISNYNDFRFRIDLGSSDIAFRRMKEAMNSFYFDPQKQLEQELKSNSDIILRGTHLRDILLPDSTKFKIRTLEDSTEILPSAGLSDLPVTLTRKKESKTQSFDGIFTSDHRLASWCKRYSRSNPIVIDGDPDFSGLNASQQKAIAMMVSEKLSLVQGPPGTGKTKTLIEAIRLLKAGSPCFGSVRMLIVL